MSRISKITVAAALFCMACIPAAAGQKMNRYDDNRPVIAAKGSWLIGGTAAYTAHSNEDYSFAVVQDINSVGFNANLAPEVCWFVSDNLGVGVKMSYGRYMLDAATGSAEFGTISIGVDDYYTVRQAMSAAAFLRYYIPIGDSSRFAMFADAGLVAKWGHRKDSEQHTGAEVGTWQNDWKGGLVVNPGLMAYLSKRMSMFASVGMAGLTYGKASQVHNQVDEGSRGAFAFSYMLDLTALNIGLDFHFGKR